MSSQPERDRLARARDFAARATASPSSVLAHPAGWRYIPVHHFEEPSLDAYCLIDEDLYFVQVWSAEHDPAGRAPGLYFRWSPGTPALFNIVAVAVEARVSRSAFESVLLRCAPGLPPAQRPEHLVPFPEHPA